MKPHSKSEPLFAKHAFTAMCSVLPWSLACFLTLTTFRVALGQPSPGPIQSGAPVVLNDGLPRELKDMNVQQKLGDLIPLDVPMIDSDGNSMKLSQVVDGQLPLLLTLNYSNCPMLCNVQLNQLAQSLEKADVKIGEDFRLLSLSIDPTETAQRLTETKQRYVEQVDSHPSAAKGWWFCRSDKESIDRLAESVGFPYKYDEKSKEYAHPAMLAFVSPGGVITRYSLGVAFPPDQMKLAVVEAGEGNVGNVIDQFVLWCYAFDPTENSYVPQAWKIMKLGGAVTVLVLFLTLLPYWMNKKGSAALSTPTLDPSIPQSASAGPQ